MGEDYKKYALFLCLILAGLPDLTGKESATTESGASIQTAVRAVISRTDGGVNLDGRVKPDRFVWETEGQFYGLWYPSSFFTLQWDLLLKTTTANRRQAVIRRGASNETASFKVEFRKFYGEWLLPEGGSLGMGRQPYSVGETFLYSPANYLDPAGGLDSDNKSFWHLGTEWSLSDFTFTLTWIPSLIIPVENKNEEWYSHLKFLENSNKGGIFALRVGWFPYPLNVNLFAYLKEKKPWEMNALFVAGALTASWSIFPELIVKGEAFVGNGFNHQYHFSTTNAPLYGQWTKLDGNRAYAKITGGLSWGLFSWLELSTEYLFNGTGMEGDTIADLEEALLREDLSQELVGQTGKRLSPLDMGRHFLLFRTSFVFPEQNLIFDPYFLISLPDGSFSQKGDIEWTPTDDLTLTAAWLWFGSQRGGLFSLIPQFLTITIGAKYAF